MAAEVGYGCGGGAFVGVAGGDGGEIGRGIAQVGGNDAIVLEDYGAFGAGDFNAAGIAGIGGSGGEQRADRAVGEFQSGDGGVFRLDFFPHGWRARLYAWSGGRAPQGG